MLQQTFRHERRVSYALCTVGNHVYYSRYLDLLEEARGEFLRHIGHPLQSWQDHGIIFPVIECRLRYKTPARYDDVLTTELWVTEAAKVRLNLAYRILNLDRPANETPVPLVEATTFHVCTSLDDKPRRIPEDLLQALQPFVATDNGSM